MKAYFKILLNKVIKSSFTIVTWITTLILLSSSLYAYSGKDFLSEDEREWLVKNQSQIIRAVETGYAPFVFINSKDRPTGLAHDYMLLLEAKLGVHFKEKRLSTLNEIFDNLKSGEVHIVNAVTNTPDRSKFITFTEPFISVPNVIIVQNKRTGPFKEETLNGLKVSLVKGYAITEHITNKGLRITTDLVPDDITALYNVSSGHTDAAIIDLATASYLISTKGITNLRIAGETSFAIRLAMGTAVDEPMLNSIIQKGLAQITEAERKEIRSRWINVSNGNIFADWRFWAVVIGALLALCAAIFGNILWNRTIRRQVALRTEELARETEVLQELKEELQAQNEELAATEEELRSQNEELLASEEMVRDSEEQYRLLVNNLASGVVVHAPDSSIIFANPMALTLLGLSKDQIKEKTAIDPDWCFLRETGETMLSEEFPVNQVLSTGVHLSEFVVGIRHSDISDPVWVQCNAYPVNTVKGSLQKVVVTFTNISGRKQAEEALSKRLVTLTQPIENTTISFEELFNLKYIQRLQDQFAKATGVASIITDPDGIPLTAPSNFTRLCNDIIRKNEKGCTNCFKSDATIGRYNQNGPNIQTCLSGGLWDAGAGITVGGKHIANWLIGQVRDVNASEEKMAAYAREIGVDETTFIEAFREVPSMSHEQFEHIAQTLFTLATQLSTTAYQNVQQARFINERKQAVEKILLNESRLKSLVGILQYPAETIQGFLDNALNEAINLTASRIGYIYFYDEERREFELNSWSNDVMKECSVVNPLTIYPLEKTGFWGEAVRQRKTIIMNEFAAENPLKKGYPEGHIHLERFMSVPVFSNERIVAVVGVANKNGDYDDGDVLQLTLLMDAVWKYIENKRSETALQDERKLSQTYLDTVETMIVALDAGGTITTANRKALLILGYREDELLGKSWFTTCLPQPDGIDVIYPHFLKIMAGDFGSTEYHENAVVTKNGEIRQIAWHNALLSNEQGQIIGTLSAGDDITERKRAEEEKLKLESQLQQAQKMESVGRLAGGVAHDFNNMLAVIMGHAELGLMKIGPNEPLVADLNEIRTTAERSADLTRQLLTFARKQAVVPKVLNLNETISGMLKMLQRLIGENIQLTWQAAADLWQTKIDPSQIDQILANLCVNARDAIEDTGKITINTENCNINTDYCANHQEAVPGEYVRLSVSDDGVGIAKETLAHIFEPFYTTKEIGKGTGLGLATVYGAVKQNNGFISIYSEPGQGTTFSIYLLRDATSKNSQSEVEGPAVAVPHGQETILLVEDEPAILNIASLMLEKQGYTVLKADTPSKAIELAREQHGEIHLLMTDVIMPEMNGRDLAKNVLSVYPGLKLLFMSGYTADVIAHHGVLDEGVNFIQKPFSLPNMAAMVREVLDSN